MRSYVIDTARALASAGVLLSAVVHLDLYELQGYRQIDSAIGPLFLLDVIAGLILGVLVLVWRHWFSALLAAGFGAVTVVAFWISVVRPHGIFGVHERPGTSSAILAEVAEYVAVVFGLVAAAALWRRRTA